MLLNSCHGSARTTGGPLARRSCKRSDGRGKERRKLETNFNRPQWYQLPKEDGLGQAGGGFATPEEELRHPPAQKEDQA
jgi:hypothetical protein